MKSLRYILKNLTILNILLIAGIVAGALYITSPGYRLALTPPPQPQKKAETSQEATPAAAPAPSPLDFSVIAEQNLFHPERKIPVDKTAEQALPKPEFVLYGTLITDSVSIAYLEDKKMPVSTPGRGKRQSALKKGDSLSGFVLKEIEAEKVVMVRGEEAITVPVHDTQKAKMREVAAATPPAATQQQAPAVPQQQGQQQAQTTVKQKQKANGKERLKEPPPYTPEVAEKAKKAFTDFFNRSKQKK